MNIDPRRAALAEHQRWLDYIQPQSAGLVVSAAAMVDSQVQLDISGYALVQEEFLDALSTGPDGQAVVEHFATFARSFLEWNDELLAIYSVADEVPDILRATTGEHGELLTPSAAYKYFKPAESTQPYMLLVKQFPLGTDLDQQPDAKKERGWIASAHQKFERLLRETNVPIGVLCNGKIVRFVYAPKGENSGWLTFPVDFMGKIEGRAVASALKMLLCHLRLVGVAENSRLPAVLRRSRDYQANVSTELSHQVLEALYELARGFQAADDKAHGALLGAAWERDPQEIYGGLITALLRTVFLLYAEDRGLMPTGEVYQSGYSVQSLFSQLRSDNERYPDTMDDRFGAWPRLLALFRAVYGGCRHPAVKLPARRGHLFDPDRYPFLEGRADARHELGETLPRISDGCIYRVMNLLLFLDGERLSYRTLEVEQIGSVYETIMGFHVEKAAGRCIALKPKKKHGAPIHLDLDHLLTLSGAARDKLLKDEAETELPAKAAQDLKAAVSLDDLLAAVEKRIDRRATPHPLPAGSIILQPTDERRRSGSHYTPRSFTEPIVRKTLEPILDRLGRHPRSEAILDLKIADIAVGSAAFLVETCRQLAEELVASWHFHKCLPVIPPDEDEILVARRVIAQRCLYGVDRNPMAVDLAKLSLWLTTMAKDHPFTFVDHAIKCGDSLVGLTNKQIASFHWDLSQAKQKVLGEDRLEKAIKRISDERKRILEFSEDTEAAVIKKREFLAAADDAAEFIRNTGDLVIAAFFAGSKAKERQERRDEFLQRHLGIQRGQDIRENLSWQVRTMKDLRSGAHPLRPFHWEIEFPEAFMRLDPGFDGIVGNPPFAGKNSLVGSNREHYLPWLQEMHAESHGNSDLVAHFFRRAFTLLSSQGSAGLIATNTVAQGDTRATGLRWICIHGGKIYAAQRRVKWPGQAAVIVSVVHMKRGVWEDSCELDGICVDRITAYLFHAGSDENPARLATNQGLSFIGSYVLGMGFTFDDTDTKGVASYIATMERLVADDPSNATRIFPYIGGEEVNGSPTQAHHRFVIDFEDFPLDRGASGTWRGATRRDQEVWLASGSVPRDYSGQVAQDWPDLLAIVRQKVKPDREHQGSIVNPKWWFRFARPASDLRACVRSKALEHVLVISRIQPNWGVSLMPASSIFAESIVVFAAADLPSFCHMQCRVHEIWARFFSSSMKDDMRYAPTDCFETFPFPGNVESNTHMAAAGKKYYEFRAELMIRNDEGLTKTYNRFHDPEETSPDIIKLRELHAAMDRAVLDAYRWPDISTDCEFLLDYEEEEDNPASTADYAGASEGKRRKKKPWRYRWPDEVRDEVLARLLDLNQKRHEEEVRLGIAPGMKKAVSSPPKRVKATSAAGHKHPELGL